MSGKLGISIVLAIAALLGGVSGAGGCVGTPQQTPICDGPEGCADAALGDEAAAAVPIPVAAAVEPTPVNGPVAGDLGPDSDVTGDAGGPTFVWLPWLGWGSTIDLLDLLATGGLGDALDPATEIPGSFTYLELLCQDQGFSDSHCRSRYGGP